MAAAAGARFAHSEAVGALDRGLLVSVGMARRLEGAAREALLLRREVLLGLRRQHQHAEGVLLSDRAPDLVDLAAIQSGAASLERLSESELRELDEVLSALTRIDEGSYGLCEDCGGEIATRRLEAIPWAGLCVECAVEAEAQRSRRLGA